MVNFFQNGEKSIVAADIKAVEDVLNYSLPEEFVSHYLSFNGGVPTRAWWVNDDDFEPLGIALLKPFKYNKLNDDNPKSLIDGCHIEMTRRNIMLNLEKVI